MALALGIIPDYQFSSDPLVNPYGINPNVTFPQGMTQLTVQPVGQYVTSGDPSLAGPQLYGVFDSWWWQNRRMLAISAVAVGGLGLAALAFKLLR